MKFNYKENMCVNVKEAIEKSTKNDYVDFGDALGVIVHKSSYFKAIIVYRLDCCSNYHGHCRACCAWSNHLQFGIIKQ